MTSRLAPGLPCPECDRQGTVQYRAVPVVPGGQLAALLGHVLRMPFGFSIKTRIIMAGLVCTNCGSGQATGRVLGRVIMLERSRDLDVGYVNGQVVYQRLRPRQP